MVSRQERQRWRAARRALGQNVQGQHADVRSGRTGVRRTHADGVAEEGAEDLHEGGPALPGTPAGRFSSGCVARDAPVEGAMKGVAKGALSRSAGGVAGTQTPGQFQATDDTG